MAWHAEPVADAEDPRLADFRHLRDPELRRRRGLFVAEGALVVRRLIEGGRFRTRAAVCTPAALEALRDVLLEAAAPESGAPRENEGPAALAGTRPYAVYLVSQSLIERLAGYPFHRGCLAVAERGDDLELERLAGAPGPRLLIALDGVADPDNVGAVFRNGRAFAADGVVLSPGAGDPLSRKAIRTSAGATLELPFSRAADWPAGLALLRARGFTLLALTPDPEAIDIWSLIGSAGGSQLARAAVLVGSEGTGLGGDARRAADLCARIAMTAGVDSLNVATATGIALHALARARQRLAADP